MAEADEQAVRIKLEQGISRNAKHIFRDREGHFSIDTLEHRQLFIAVVRPKNYLGSDKYGTQWYAKTLISGEQIWVQVRSGEIRNAGRNLIPKDWHPETGLATKSTL